jgi:hypothetical protein
LALTAQVEEILGLEVLLSQSVLLLVTQVEALLALEVLLPQAVQVTQAVVDFLRVLLVSQVFNDGYTLVVFKDYTKPIMRVSKKMHGI